MMIKSIIAYEMWKAPQEQAIAPKVYISVSEDFKDLPSLSY